MKGDNMKVNNIKLNFLDNYYMFYDWLKDDIIENKNNLNVYKVPSKTIDDFMGYQVELLDLKYLKEDNVILFTDDFSYIAIEFNNNGKSIFKSSLTLEDEIKINKKIENLKQINIPYKKIKLEKRKDDLRLNEIIRKTIQVELNGLQKIMDNDKIAYLYYTWFKKTSNNNKNMLSTMLKKIQMPLTSEEIKIYNLIKNKYKLV